MTTPMTFEEWWNDLFKDLQNDAVWSIDELHNLATMSWQASQAQQAKVIAELQTDLSQAKETIETLNAGKPIGDIVGLHIAQNAVTKALGYKQTIAELVEALEEAMYSNSTETAKQKYQAIIAKVKDK